MDELNKLVAPSPAPPVFPRRVGDDAVMRQDDERHVLSGLDEVHVVVVDDDEPHQGHAGVVGTEHRALEGSFEDGDGGFVGVSGADVVCGGGVFIPEALEGSVISWGSAVGVVRMPMLKIGLRFPWVSHWEAEW